jgi:hypothetical protein
MNIRIYPIALITCLFTVAACTIGSEKKTASTTATNSKETPQIKSDLIPDVVFDQFAKIVCGKIENIPPNIDAVYYDSFANKLNQKLLKIDKVRLNPISKWNADALKRNLKSDTTPVFYPFSGGDFLHLNSLYPNANHYVLMAKESVGSIPDLTAMDKSETKSYILAVDNILRDIYDKSYFITKNMNKDINSTLVNGMLPVLLWSVSKTGYIVTKVEELHVDEIGNKTYLPFQVGQSEAKAVRITFGDPKVRMEKTLTYYSCDISDAGIEQNRGLEFTLKKIPPSNCFVKSASYLMHYHTFSKIRNVVMEKAIYLVQDDTGIPYKYFDKSKFKFELYGTYIKPVADFSSNLFQTDMAEAYKTNEFKSELLFSLGYHWQTKNQNQMIAIRL